MQLTFRQKLAGSDLLIGSFVKTPATAVVEIAGLVGLDFVVLDQEHGALTVRDLDLGILAGRVSGIDVLVRLPSGSPHFVQQALDLGAAGVVVPHVHSTATAAAIVAAARFGGGKRGYSNSPRFGDYGEVAMAELLSNADANAAVILQIEDAEAVEAVEEIAAVPGIDALFIGRADLMVAYGANTDATAHVDKAAARIARAAGRGGVATGTFYPSAEAFAVAPDESLRMVILGSDQSMMRSGWSSALAHGRALPGAAIG